MERFWRTDNFHRILPIALLLFLLNLFLVGWVTWAFSHPDSAYPFSREALEASYADSRVLNTVEKGRLQIRILQSPDGTVRLTAVKKAPFRDLCKIISDEELALPGHTTIHTGTTRIFIAIDAAGTVTRYDTALDLPAVPESTLLWSMCLLVLELVFWFAFDKIRNV